MGLVCVGMCTVVLACVNTGTNIVLFAGVDGPDVCAVLNTGDVLSDSLACENTQINAISYRSFCGDANSDQFRRELTGPCTSSNTIFPRVIKV